MEASFQKRPQFAFQDMFESGIFHPVKYEQTDHSNHITHDQKISRASDSSCALSLLSCLPAGNSVASSLVCHSICSNHSDEQVSEFPLGVNSLDKYVQNKSTLHGMNLTEAIKNGSMCQPSDLSNVKHHLSPEDGATVDLFQLSSHLQRVEHQRNSFLQ